MPSMKNLLYILYQPYKWLIYLPLLFALTFFFGIVAVVISLLFGHKLGSLLGGNLWARVVGIITPIFVKVEGKENIDKKQSYVLVSNHLSQYDIFVLYGYLGMDIKWVMKKELKKIPGIGFGSQAVGHIFIDRSSPRDALESIKNAKKRLVGGTSVIVFPEGTRSKTGETGMFKRGAFKLAFDVNLPILPISISGTNKILPTGTIRVFPGKAKVKIHKPVSLEGYDFKTNAHELTEKVRKIIISGVE